MEDVCETSNEGKNCATINGMENDRVNTRRSKDEGMNGREIFNTVKKPEHRETIF